MKKILILLCGCLLLFAGIARSQTWYVNMPDTVCMSTNSSTADQIKFTSMNAQLASGQQTKMTWTITTPNNSAADYNILYSENSSTVKATQLTLTNLLTLQFLATGKYTFVISTSYKSGNTTKTVTTTKSIYVIDCTITTCSGGDAEMPGFTEDFGTLPSNATRKAYSPASAVGYTYVASGDPADNYYAISNSTHLKGDWITTSDHTGSTRGGMLVANSSYTPTIFFQKEVDGLCRGSVYNFSAWFINADSSLVMTSTCASGFIYAGVTFQIVNAANTSQILASFRTYAVSPNFSKATWQRFGGSFTVPSGVTDVIVRIVNNFPGGCGNDIAVDDIQFSYCSPIITASILGSASNLKEVLCEGVATTLVSSYTPTNYFTNAEYQWEMSDDGGVTWFNVPYGTANKDTLVIKEGELVGTKDVAADYLFRVRIYESGSSSATCAAPSSSVKITILPMPVLYLTKAQVCEGGTVELQASGGYDYFKWSDTSYVGPDRQITVVKDTTITVYGYVTYGVDGGKTCIDSNSASIKKDDKPLVEVAASDTALCVGSRVTLSIAEALAPNGDATKSIRWYKGTNIATATLLSDFNDQTGMIYNTETLADSSFIVVVTSGTCTVTSAPFIIHLTEVPAPPAGTHVTKCVEDGTNASGTFTMTRSTITGTRGVWTITGISGPGISGDTSSTINFSDYVTLNKNNPAATVTLNNPGMTVYLQWTVTSTNNSDCVGYAYDTLTLITGATTAYAGPDTTLCGTNNVFTMQANEPDISLTGDFAETGTWTLVSGTGVTIDDIHAYNTTVRVTNGSYQDVTLAWTIKNASSCGTNSDQVVLHYTALPTLTLKPDTVCNTQGYFTMDTTATTGNPTYYSVTGSMTGFSAVPETQITAWPITIPIPTGVASGVYTFTVNFRSDNGGCSNSTTIKVNVEAPPTAPTSVTVSSPSICTSGSATLTVVGGTLGTNANGTTAGRYVWYAGGCGSGTSIGTGSSITVAVSATTTYYVRVESNGKCGATACASGTVTVYTAPTTSNAGPAQTHCNDSLFTMAANAASVGAGAWTYTGTATITNTTSPTTTVFVPAGKTATLTWTITNGACTTASTVVLTNYMQPVAANAGPDSIKNCANSTFTMQATAASPSTATGTWSTFTGSKATITTGMFNNPAATVTLAAGDTATLKWTVTNGTCSSVDYVKLFNYATPTTANAGPDSIKQCATPAFTMSATTPTVGTGKWSIKTGTATIGSTDSSKVNAVITVATGSTAILYWTVTNGTCSSKDSIVLVNYAMPTTANAGPDSIVQCNIATFTMLATAAAPATAVGTWSTFTSSKATITTGMFNNPAATVTLAAGDTATLKWTVTNGVCSSTDYVFLKNYQAPATAQAGPDSIKQCANPTFTMSATAASVGVGTWTVSKATATITNPNSTTATITVPAGDSVWAYWTIVNGACSTKDSVKLVNYVKPTDAEAGPDQHQCATTTFTMAGNAPSVATASGLWTKPTGSTATIANPTSATTTVTLPTGDSTKLYWTITNGACTTKDSVWIVNNLAPTAANAGPDTVKQCNNATFTMTANSPSVSGAWGTWTVVSPTSYTISSAQLNNPTATFNVNAGQTVVLKWTITNIGCTSSDNIVLINYVQPTATSAGTAQTHCSDSLFTLAGSTPMTGATGYWYVRSGKATVTTPTSATSTVIVPAGQTALLRWVITNGVCADSAAVTLINYMQPVAANAGPDSIKNCANSAFTMQATAASPSTAVGTWSTFTGSKATITTGMFNNPAASVTLAAGDTATLIWTVTNGTCSSVDYVKLFNYATPTTANAGPDSIKQCATPAFTMSATTPTVGTGKWSIKTGTATIGSTDSSKVNAVITVATGSTAILYWTVTNGTCSSKDSIVLVNYAMPTTANAGPDSIVQCNIATFTMLATAAAPATAVGTWSTFTGSKATITTGMFNNPAATVTLAAGDTATLKWTVTNGVCSSTDYVFLKNYQAPATANAGPDSIKQCANPTFTMSATAASVGVGTWTVSKATATITNPNSTTATITVPVGDSVWAYWTIVNGTCSTKDSVKLVNYVKPVDAEAGPDQHQCATTTFTMAANAPSVSTASGMWTKPTGSTATIANPTSATTTVTLPTGDSTKLYWTITNGACTTKDSVWIVNNLSPAAANAGPDTVKQCNNATFTMTANTPSVSGAWGTWTVVSPASYTISAAQLNNPTATFSVTAGQTVVLKWTITNIGCTSSDNIVLINYVQPTATSAGTAQQHCSDSLFTLAGSTPMTGATGYWYVRSGTATVTTPTSATSTVIVPAGQTALLRWVITNGVCSDSAAVTITNYMQPVAANAGPDSIKNCANSSFTMQATTPAIGTGTWSTFTGSKATITTGMFNNPAATVTMAAGDTATLIWTVTNGLCSSVDYVKLFNYATPSTANAGPDTIKQCMTPAFTMAATTPTIGTGKWSVKSGTPVIAATDSSNINAVITIANNSTATLYWTVTNGTCSNKDSIVLINYQSPDPANAGLDSIVQCNNTSFTMAATTPNPATAVGTWTLFTGSKASIATADIHKINPVITLPAGDTATAIWTVTNGVCSSSDYIFLKNYQAPSTANAGPDSTKQCADGTFTMSATAPTIGAGTWTVSKATATIANPTSTTAVITVPVGDSVMAYWTVVNGTCSSVDSVKLVNYVKPADADAGPDQHLCSAASFTMAANAPSVATASGAWSKPAGSTATIASINSPTTTVTIPVGDSSMLFWTITNGVCSDVDTVWVVNNNPPAAADAGVDTLRQCNYDAFTMAANTPSVAGATGYWSVISPAAYTISAAQLNDPATTFTVTAGSTVVLKWTITNLGCTSSDSIVLINNEQPTAVSAGTDQTKCAGSAFVLAGSTPNVTGAIGTWYVRSGIATIATGEEHDANAHVTLPNDASAELHWVVTNGVCADSAAVILTNYLTPVKADAGADTVKHCSDSAFVMNANEPDVTGAIGEWTFIGTTTAVPNDPNDPKTTIIVPAGDSVLAIWTIGNGTCSTSDTVKLVNYMSPTAAAVPADMQQCMTTTFPVTANAPDVPGAIGYWTVVTGHATFPAADLNNNSTTFTVPNGDSAYISWTLTNGVCYSADTIKLYNYQQPAQADAGADSLVQCNNTTFTMAATAPNLTTAVGKWSLYPGSAASFSATDSTNINVVFTLPAGDTATAIWTVTNGVCSSYDVILLKNYEAPAQADAGPDSLKHCNDAVFTMSATAPSLTTAIGTWTVSKTTATITNANSTTATINVPAGDSVMAYWTITNGVCATVDSIKLVNYQQPTAAAAGTDTHQCATSAFTLAANTPDVAGAVGTWTLPAGSTATIAAADVNKPNATINVPEGDSVIATWTITNGVCTSSSTVKLVNDKMPDVANAGTAQTHCADSAFVMTANTASIGTGTWSFYTGSTATIATADLNNPAAKIFVPAGDTATAIWTITNNSCATSSTVFLTNYMMPEAANAGANQTHCNDSAFIMTATPGAIATSKGTWTVISGTATIAAADLNNPTAKVIVLVNTTAVLQWTLTNGTCTGTPATVTLTNLGPVMGNTISADQTVCASETPAQLKGTTTLSGGDGTFTYQWQISTTSATTGFSNVTTGTGGTSAAYTPATLTADTVWFRRIVTSGACSTTISNVVKIRRITTPPVVVSVPAAITTDCVLGKDYTTMFGTPVFSHQPFTNEALTVTYTDNTQTPDACTTIIMRTWTAVDRCGLTTSAQQTITVIDTKAPVFTTTAPADVTVECDQVPAAVNLTANDACIGTLTIAPIETRVDIAGQCTSNYYLIRKWVAVDNCGNASDTLKQTITVRDQTGPVFSVTAPANITVDCDKVPTAATLTATDNCTPGTITVTPVDTRQTISGAKCSNTYQITRTWTATDNCGNATVVKQIITVQDTTRPAFSMTLVADTTVNCDAVPALPTITATDNCSANVTVSVSQTKVFLSTTCSNNYRLTRTWTAADDCGNTATMKQVITVQDTTKPTFTITPPSDTTVSCSAVPTPPSNLSATDNCTATSNVKISYSQTRQSITGACASNYQLIRVWTAKDECGNTNIVRQIITVVDTTKPVMDPAPAAVTVTCGGTIPAAATLYATDNCDGNFPKKATMTTDPYTVDACNGYTITRRWNIADACGNAAIERVQIITVEACPKPQLDATLPVNCSDNTKFALQLLTKVSKPTFTLQSVYPAGIVTTPKSQTSNVFDLNGATQATFIVTDGTTGCVSDPVTYTLQYVTKPTVDLGADVAICQGNTVTLDAGAANASAGYTIKWNTGATTQQITVSAAGTYYATVTNAGCSATDSIKVTVNTPPTVDIRDTTICDGMTVKLNAYVQGASYTWSTGDTGPSITVSTAGTYTVDVSLNGCTVTDQATVTVATAPNVTVTADTSVCPDQTVMLQVEPDGGSVKWSDGSLTNSIIVSKPGDYWVTVTKNSCVVVDTITVTNKANINLDLGADKDICAGGLVVLDATNASAISYLWNDGTTDPIKEVSTPGTYTVTVLDRYCNLTSTDSVKVTVAGIGDISLGNDTTICIGQTLTLSVDAGTGNSIRWQDGATSSTYVVTTTGYYKVTVYNDCGSVTDDITVTYKQCEAKPDFPNAFTPNGDGNNDSFKPHVSGPMYDYDLRVFNRWGQVVFLSKDQSKGWDGRFQGTLVDVGTYVYLLSYKNTAGGETRVVKGEVTVVR